MERPRLAEMEQGGPGRPGQGEPCRRLQALFNRRQMSLPGAHLPGSLQCHQRFVDHAAKSCISCLQQATEGARIDRCEGAFATPSQSRAAHVMVDVSERETRGNAFLQIGEAAILTHLTQRTLRFYEERGLLHPPERMQGGFRLYSPADIERLERIKQLKELLGFSLSEIGEMLDAEELAAGAAGRHVPPEEHDCRSDTVRDGLQRQLELIDEKMAGMARLREQIAARLSHYERPWPGTR